MRQPEKENGASSLWNLNRRTLLISSTRLCFTAHVSPLSHVGNSCHSYCRKFVFLFWLRVPALLIKSQQCVMKWGCCFQNGRSHFNTHFVCVCVCVCVCVSAAEQMYLSSSLVANAARTRMYRKLSKEGAHRLAMPEGYDTTLLFVFWKLFIYVLYTEPTFFTFMLLLWRQKALRSLDKIWCAVWHVSGEKDYFQFIKCSNLFWFASFVWVTRASFSDPDILRSSCRSLSKIILIFNSCV